MLWIGKLFAKDEEELEEGASSPKAERRTTEANVCVSNALHSNTRKPPNSSLISNHNLF